MSEATSGVGPSEKSESDADLQRRRRFLRKLLLGSAGVVLTGSLPACTDGPVQPEPPPGPPHNPIVSVLDWGADNGYDPTTETGEDSAEAFQNAIDALFDEEAATELHVPNGGYLIDRPLDLKGKYLKMVGAGLLNTRLYAGENGDPAIDINEANNVITSSGLLRDMAIEHTRPPSSHNSGQGIEELGATGIHLVKRHFYEMGALYIIGFDVGIRAHYTWECRWQNTKFLNNRIGMLLEGWNNRCKLDTLSFQGDETEVGLYIGRDDPNNENNSIELDSCDFQFIGRNVQGVGLVNDSNRTVLLRNCYSEQVGGPVIHAKSGLTYVKGGFFNFNRPGGENPLIYLDGGRVIVEKADLLTHSADAPPVSQLARGADGTVVFSDCYYPNNRSGVALFEGDIFGYGPGKNYVPALGRLWEKKDVSGHAEARVQANALKVTWRSEGIVSVSAPLDTSYFRGEDLYLLVVYASAVDLNVKLSGGAGAALPNKQVVALPSTEGAVRTALKLDANWGTEAFTLLEFLGTAAPRTSFTLYEVTLTDARAMRTGGAPDGDPSNFYKILSQASQQAAPETFFFDVPAEEAAPPR